MAPCSVSFPTLFLVVPLRAPFPRIHPKLRRFALRRLPIYKYINTGRYPLAEHIYTQIIEFIYLGATLSIRDNIQSSACILLPFCASSQPFYVPPRSLLSLSLHGPFKLFRFCFYSSTSELNRASSFRPPRSPSFLTLSYRHPFAAFSAATCGPPWTQDSRPLSLAFLFLLPLFSLPLLQSLPLLSELYDLLLLSPVQSLIYASRPDFIRRRQESPPFVPIFSPSLGKETTKRREEKVITFTLQPHAKQRSWATAP